MKSKREKTITGLKVSAKVFNVSAVVIISTLLFGVGMSFMFGVGGVFVTVWEVLLGVSMATAWAAMVAMVYFIWQATRMTDDV